MNTTEIKKLYTKTKKAYEKRTGKKYTWVMNARQQRLGTATVLAGYPVDYCTRLYRAAKALSEADDRWAIREADYLNRAREEIRRNRANPNRTPDTFWQEHTTPEALAESKRSFIDDLTRYRDRSVSLVEKHGSWDEYYQAELKEAEELINSPEVQEFLKAIGGTASLEIKEHPNTERSLRFAEMYVRFHYQATEA